MIKIRLVSLIVIISFTFCEKNNDSDDPCSGLVDKDFMYPPFPENGWKTDNWFEESKAHFAIPVNVLECISTTSLITTCLNHPQKALLYAYSTRQDGFEIWVEQCNGFEELFHREDAGSILLTQYKQMNPFNENLSENDFLEFEITLSQPVILSKLTSIEKEKLLTFVFELNQDKIDAGFKYDDGKIGGYLAMGRLMFTDRYEPFIEEFERDSLILLRIFVLEAEWLYNDWCKPDEIISEHALDYLNTFKK